MALCECPRSVGPHHHATWVRRLRCESQGRVVFAVSREPRSSSYLKTTGQVWMNSCPLLFRMRYDFVGYAGTWLIRRHSQCVRKWNRRCIQVIKKRQGTRYSRVATTQEACVACTSLVLKFSFDILRLGAHSRPLSCHPLTDLKHITPGTVATSAKLGHQIEPEPECSECEWRYHPISSRYG